MTNKVQALYTRLTAPQGAHRSQAMYPLEEPPDEPDFDADEDADAAEDEGATPDLDLSADDGGRSLHDYECRVYGEWRLP